MSEARQPAIAALINGRWRIRSISITRMWHHNAYQRADLGRDLLWHSCRNRYPPMSCGHSSPASRSERGSNKIEPALLERRIHAAIMRVHRGDRCRVRDARLNKSDHNAMGLAATQAGA